MNKTLILLLFSCISLFGQSKLDSLIIGNWDLKAFKYSGINSFNLKPEENGQTVIKGDSVLSLQVTKDSIYIFRNQYYSKDTFSFTYKTSHQKDKYGKSTKKIILYLTNEDLKIYRKRHRKNYSKISFTINKINNSQLTFENFLFEPNQKYPFIRYTVKEYAFQKKKSKNVNELNFKGNWYFNYETYSPFQRLDTLILSRDSLVNDNNYTVKTTFRIKNFTPNNFTLKQIHQPKPKHTKVEVLKGVYIISHFSIQDWEIDTKKKLLYLQSNNKYLVYKYSFEQNQLFLIKNGS